jgi:2-haloacid dehalogenase
MTEIRSLFFDVFGTVVDWRGGVAREAEALLAPLGYELDWFDFADAWRGEYQPAMEEVRAGRIPFSKLDVLHRRNLDRIRPRFGLNDLSEDNCRKLNLAWHRLDGISLMVDLARRNDFVWDAILGAEVAGDYKPKPEVYDAACGAFGLPPEQCMMVAAHSSDLAAAAARGLRTAHIARPNEHGTGKGEAGPTVPVDVAASDLVDLAGKLSV